MNGDAIRKLPVWRTVGESYQATVMNWRYAIRISWAWLPVLIALSTAMQLLSQQAQVEGPPDTSVAWRGLAMFPILLGYFLPLSSISVAWHRKLLRGESWPHLIYLRLDRIVGRYWLYGLLVMIIFFLICVAIGAVVAAVGIGLHFLAAPLPREALFGVMAVVAVPAVILIVLLMVRLFVLLPGIALDQQRLSPRNAWRHTRKNTWRIFLGALLCWLPPAMVLGGLVYTVVSGLSSVLAVEPGLSPTFVLLVAVDQVTSVLIGFFGLSFLALAYRFFFEPESLPQQDAAL